MPRKPEKAIAKAVKEGKMAFPADTGENAKTLLHAIMTANLANEKLNTADPQAVKNRIADYMKLCMDNDVNPTVEGLSVACGVSRVTFFRWVHERNKTMPAESLAALKKAYAILNMTLIDRLQNQRGNPAGLIFLAKNTFGYVDETHVTYENNDPLGSRTSDAELQKRYDEIIDVDYKE